MGTNGLLFAAWKFYHCGSFGWGKRLDLPLGNKNVNCAKLLYIPNVVKKNLFEHVTNFCSIHSHRYCCGTCLFFPWRCIPQSTRWQQMVKDTYHSVSVAFWPSSTDVLMMMLNIRSAILVKSMLNWNWGPLLRVQPLCVRGLRESRVLSSSHLRKNRRSWFLTTLKWFVVFMVLTVTILYFRKMLFDTAEEDANYNPLPEERPGGFAWGEGQRLGG